MKRSFLLLLPVLFIGWVGFFPSPSLADGYDCNFICVRAHDPVIDNCRGTAIGSSRSVMRFEAFSQTVHVVPPTGSDPVCSASTCAARCRTACGGRNVSDRGATGWTHGETACLGALPVPTYLVNAFTDCSSLEETTPLISADWVRTNSTPQAVPHCVAGSELQGAGSGAGSCAFTCARDATSKAPYQGPRVACSAAADCSSRCNDDCRNAMGNGYSCVLQNFTPTPPAGELPRCNGATATPGSPTTLDNPLNTSDIGELIARFIRAISGIAGSMALLMFVVGGVMWMTAEGSDRVKTAQTILKNASLGLILIFFAYSIVSLFLSVLGL